MNRASLIITVGLPRSGKSTWAMKQGHPVVNPDSIRLALHGQRFLPEAESMVWAMAEYMVKALFLAGHTTVILDACNVTAKRRDVWDKFCEKYDYCFEAEVFKVKPKTCIERARAMGDDEIIPIIERMVESSDIPFDVMGGSE